MWEPITLKNSCAECRHRELHGDRIIRKGPKYTGPTFSLSSETSPSVSVPAMVLNSRVKFLLSKDINWEFTLILFFSGFVWDEMIARYDSDSTRQSVPPMTSFELRVADEKEWEEELVYAAGEGVLLLKHSSHQRCGPVCHATDRVKISQGAHRPYFTFCSLSPSIRCHVTFNIFHLLVANMVWYCSTAETCWFWTANYYWLAHQTVGWLNCGGRQTELFPMYT